MHRRSRILVIGWALAAIVSATAVGLAGQEGSTAADRPFTPPKSTYEPPRTPWGDPDLQGVYLYRSGIPMQRPADLAGKNLTDQEVVEWAKRNARLAGNGDACGVGTREGEECSAEALAALGSHNEFWTELGYLDLVPDYRTSLIVDPPDGRYPPLTPAAQRRQQEIVGPRAQGRSRLETFTDFTPLERCLGTQTPAGPIVDLGGVSWVQSPGWVVIIRERFTTRMIPLDGRPHVDPNIRMWDGHSVGRFEGNTLVVETTNFTDKQAGGGVGTSVPRGLPFGNFKLVEHWVPVSADRLHYYATLEDPTTWTRSWTFMIPWARTPGYQLIEYACHEGNLVVGLSLAGERAAERKALEKASVPAGQTSAALVGLAAADLRAKLGEPALTEFDGARWTYRTVSGTHVLNVFMDGGRVKIVQPDDLPLDQVSRQEK